MGIHRRPRQGSVLLLTAICLASLLVAVSVLDPARPARAQSSDATASPPVLSAEFVAGSNDADDQLGDMVIVRSDVSIGGAPANATIVGVDIHLIVDYTNMNDLYVYVRHPVGESRRHELLRAGDGAGTHLDRWWTNITAFNGLHPNGVWSLFASDAEWDWLSPGAGYLRYWYIKVYYTTPAPTPTATPTQPSGAGIRLSPPTLTASYWEVFEVAIRVQANAQPVDGAQAVVLFDPVRLTVVDAAGLATTQITPGSAFDTHLFNAVDNTAGVIVYSDGQLAGPPINSNVTLATIRFKPSAMLGPTSVHFGMTPPRQTVLTLGGANVLASSAGGTYTVKAISLRLLYLPVVMAGL